MILLFFGGDIFTQHVLYEGMRLSRLSSRLTHIRSSGLKYDASKKLPLFFTLHFDVGLLWRNLAGRLLSTQFEVCRAFKRAATLTAVLPGCTCAAAGSTERPCS